MAGTARPSSPRGSRRRTPGDPPRLNKSQLVELVATEIGTSRVKAEVVVGTVLGAIAKGLRKDRGVSIVGFGTFSVRNRKARMGRNPKTGEAIRIEASRTVTFRAGRGLRASV